MDLQTASAERGPLPPGSGRRTVTPGLGPEDRYRPVSGNIEAQRRFATEANGESAV